MSKTPPVVATLTVGHNYCMCKPCLEYPYVRSDYIGNHLLLSQVVPKTSLNAVIPVYHWLKDVTKRVTVNQGVRMRMNVVRCENVVSL